MPPHPSSPLNPNARPFPYPPPQTRSSPRLLTSRFAASPSRSLAPLAGSGTSPTPQRRLSPLGPIACDVLDRGRTGSFGPAEFLPRPANAVDRIRDASNIQWARHRQGQPPLVRPGSVVAPQTIYTGHSVRPDGQEIHHAVMLNSRMLIHDPVSGTPGMINGHAVATLVAAPSDDRTWPFEIPYPGICHVRTLTNYGPATQAEVGRQRSAGNFRLGVDRSIERISNASEDSTERSPTTRRRPVVPQPPNAPRVINVPLPPISPARRTLPFRQPLPSIHAVLQHAESRAWRGTRSPFFITHPPSILPPVDTRGMTHEGIAADTGHRVWKCAPSAPGDADPNLPMRPDTPSPPTCLFTDPPALIEEPAGNSSDASMPSASEDDDAAGGAAAVVQDGSAPDAQESLLAPKTEEKPDASWTTVQKWPVSNARLEKLRYDARRCVVSQVDKRVSPFVFAATQTNEQQGSSAPADHDEMDVDSNPTEDDDDKKGSGTEETRTAFLISDPKLPRKESSRPAPNPHQPTRGPRPSSLSSLTSSAASSYYDTRSTASADSSPAPVRPAVSTRSSVSPAPDCRSVLNSPRLSPQSLGDSDSDGPPSLVSASSDEEKVEKPDESKAYVTHPYLLILADDKGRLVLRTRAPNSAAIQVNKKELDEHFARIARAPPSPTNHNWTIIQRWAQNHDNFVSRVHKSQNADALTFIHEGEALLVRFPEVLDLNRMQTNQLVDTDLVHVTQYPPISNESCTQFADRMQRIQDTINAYSPGLPDGPHVINDILFIPVSEDGKRLRRLSDRAYAQPLLYRYAILLIVKQHPGWIALYSKLRRFILAFMCYLEELFRRRQWTVDETLLHQLAPIPPPYLHPHEYSRLRLLNYTFAAHGQTDVTQVIDNFLRYRFREPEVVAHLHYAGMFDLDDVVLERDGSVRPIERRQAPQSYRASYSGLYSFREFNQPFQELQAAVAASRS
ncbi:hypothetical protein DFH06DRAFT_1325951 [Mycena polygramma]|nr:hypothetical protein DFH06DRAFT_1325951 [Mycena polygramma]